MRRDPGFVRTVRATQSHTQARPPRRREVAVWGEHCNGAVDRVGERAAALLCPCPARGVAHKGVALQQTVSRRSRIA